MTARIRWYDDGFPVMQSVLRPGKRPTAAVSHFTVTPRAAKDFNWRLAFSPGTALSRIEPGRYVRLHVGQHHGDPMMSDTPFERRTNLDLYLEASGHVLIAGLGIGMCIHALLARRRSRCANIRGPVERITVVENNADVIALVAPSLARYGDRVTIAHASIFEYTTPELYDTIYFDIWPGVTSDNLPEIATLHQRFKGRLRRASRTGPWMSSWCVGMLRSDRAAGRRGGWF